MLAIAFTENNIKIIHDKANQTKNLSFIILIYLLTWSITRHVNIIKEIAITKKFNIKSFFVIKQNVERDWSFTLIRCCYRFGTALKK